MLTGILVRFGDFFPTTRWECGIEFEKKNGFNSKLKLKNDVVDTELKADLEIFVQINFFML